MFCQNLNFLIIIDNCPSHPEVNDLKSIKLVFLPTNIINKSQPMDQGVIENLKHFYRKKLIRKMLLSINQNISHKITVYDSITMVDDAWKLVTANTISNCFRHCNCSHDNIINVADDDDSATVIYDSSDIGNIDSLLYSLRNTFFEPTG